MDSQWTKWVSTENARMVKSYCIDKKQKVFEEWREDIDRVRLPRSVASLNREVQDITDKARI